MAPAPGRRLDDRLGFAGAVPLSPRTAGVDPSDQGDAAQGRTGRAPGLGEGRGRARDDRRPRAQRSLSCLRAGERAVAGAHGPRAARRGRAPRLDGRGRATGGRRPRRAPRGHVPGRLGDGGAEDRGHRPDRGTGAGGQGRLDGRARPRARERRSRARVDDPDVRDRGRPHPPLGGRRHRLGLRSGRRGRRVAREGGAAPRRDRRASGRGIHLGPSALGRRLAAGRGGQ